MRVLLPVNPGDRFRYVSGEIKPSEVMAHVLGRLGDPDQTGVWISTVAPDAAMAAAREMDERIGEIDALPLYGLVRDSPSAECNQNGSGLIITTAHPASPCRTIMQLTSKSDPHRLDCGHAPMSHNVGAGSTRSRDGARFAPRPSRPQRRELLVGAEHVFPRICR